MSLQTATHGVPGPRKIVHPGPTHIDRIESLCDNAVTGEIRLSAGLVLIDAIGAELGAKGMRSAALDLAGLQLGPMNFVMPTYSKTPDHVAYYSETFHREGPVRIEEGTATFGSRDGAPFLHGHLLWHDADCKGMGGHILPFDTRIARDCTIRYTGCRAISMDARPDAETNFTLFGPYAEGPSDGDLIVARVRPNEDLVEAIAEIAERHQVGQGRILSVIGSTVGARFEDGLCIDKIPTEILCLRGRIDRDLDGGISVDMELALIDADGHIHRGRPVKGNNPVLICAEIFIERLSGRSGA